MSLYNDNFDKIEAYLFGKMSPADREAFEQALAQDEELAAELAVHQLEHRSMELLSRQALRDNLNIWKAEKKMEFAASIKQEAKIVSFSQRRRFFQIAAAASVLLLAGFFIWNWQKGTPDNQALASEFFDASSLGSRSKGTGTGNEPSELAPGLNALLEGDYTAAVSFFNAVTDSTYLDQAMLLKGEALFHQKDYSNAIVVYQQVITRSKDQLAVQEAEWYLLLTWLATDRKAAGFNNLLNKIADNKGHSYQQRAVELRGKLKG